MIVDMPGTSWAHRPIDQTYSARLSRENNVHTHIYCGVATPPPRPLVHTRLFLFFSQRWVRHCDCAAIYTTGTPYVTLLLTSIHQRPNDDGRMARRGWVDWALGWGIIASFSVVSAVHGGNDGRNLISISFDSIPGLGPDRARLDDPRFPVRAIPPHLTTLIYHLDHLVRLVAQLNLEPRLGHATKFMVVVVVERDSVLTSSTSIRCIVTSRA